MKVRAHIFVTGWVQGVFFRYETKRKALRSNISGWVRNLRDGRVEAIFEGEKEAVEAMVGFCREGTPAAKVEHVEVSWDEPTGELRDFQVRY